MNHKNTVKFIVSLSVVAVFVAVLFASFGLSVQLAPPVTAAGISISTPSTPTVIDRSSSVLNWSSVSGARGYIVQFYSLPSRTGGMPVLLFSRTTNTATYKITSTDNIADNTVYGWDVTATNARTKSSPSEKRYFKISSPDTFTFVTETPDGKMLKFNTKTNAWDVLLLPAQTGVQKDVATTVPAKSTPTTIVGKVIQSIANIFKPSTARISFPCKTGDGRDGTRSSFVGKCNPNSVQ